MQPAPRRILSAEFSDIDSFASAQPDGEADHMQLGAGRLRLSMTHAEFGPVVVQCNRLDNTYLARARFHRDRAAIFFDIGEEPGRSRMNGFGLGRPGAVVYGPGAELHARAEAGQAWAMITLDSGRLQHALDGEPAPREGACVQVADLLARAPALLALARDVAAVVRADPARLAGDAAAGAVVEDVMAGLAAGLGRGASRRSRAERRQVRLVAQACDYLEAALGGPVYSGAVSEALGVGQRGLNAAFRAVHGVTLQRYLQLRRLALARRSLRDGGGPELIKQVALDFGFWHFGRFAQAYRGQFGEAPSETLARRAA